MTDEPPVRRPDDEAPVAIAPLMRRHELEPPDIALQAGLLAYLIDT